MCTPESEGVGPFAVHDHFQAYLGSCPAADCWMLESSYHSMKNQLTYLDNIGTPDHTRSLFTLNTVSLYTFPHHNHQFKELLVRPHSTTSSRIQTLTLTRQIVDGKDTNRSIKNSLRVELTRLPG